MRNVVPSIKVKEKEPFDSALHRFKKSVENAGTMFDVYKHEAYEKPSTKRKRAKAAAVKRYQKKLAKENIHPKRYF
jgi:small subunit ribosomal protein S21